MRQEADKRCLDEVLVYDTIHAAFDLLEKAGLPRRVPATSPAGPPLAVSANHKRFKALLGKTTG